MSFSLKKNKKKTGKNVRKKNLTLSGRIAPPLFFRNRSRARITESSMHSKNSAYPIHSETKTSTLPPSFPPSCSDFPPVASFSLSIPGRRSMSSSLALTTVTVVVVALPSPPLGGRRESKGPKPLASAFSLASAATRSLASTATTAPAPARAAKSESTPVPAPTSRTVAPFIREGFS